MSTVQLSDDLALFEEPFRAVVERLLTERPEPFGDEPIVAVVPLRRIERPYSKSVLFEIKHPSREWRAYVKLSRPSPTLDSDAPTAEERVRSEFDLLSRIHPLFPTDSFVRVIRPIACYDEFPAIITQEAPGQPMLNELQEKASFFHGKGSVPEMEELCERCGQFLIRFQSATAPAKSGVFSLDAMREYIERRLAKITRNKWLGLDDRWRRQTLESFDSLANRLSPVDLRVAGVHGDFGLGNVLVDRGTVTVLDFPMMSEGSVVHDVTHFYHHLYQLGLHPRFLRSTVARFCSALLRGFDANLDPNHPLFRLFRLRHITCQLSRMSGPWPEPWLSRMYTRYVCKHHLRVLAQLGR